ncbi:MAG TPA: xanthine dehydrogenase family protein molybdopterin-binding subunit [Acidimicrobiales bacterium]
MSILGNRVQRVEDPRFLTGAATYVEDVPLEGAAWVTYVRSPYPHARITAIDVEEARQAPGVVGVFSGADIDLPLISHNFPMFPEEMRRPLLAGDVVRFAGEQVVAVVAEDRYVAADAAELVVVDYDALPALVDPEAAVTDEVVLFPALGTNVVLRLESPQRADFSRCEVVVSLRVENQRMTAAPIEPRSGAAYWTDDGRLVHYSACQGAHPARDALCSIYGLPPDRIRVIVPDVGGGFGAKSRCQAEEMLLGELARRTGRAVRWTETRSENMVAMPHGRGQLQHLTIGGGRDGRVTAYQLDVVQEAGAYPLIGALLPAMTQRMLTGVYHLDNVGFSSVSVVTNSSPTTAFRGAGRPEAAVAIERGMDRFAVEIGMDPAEVRRRNLVPRFMEGYTTGIGTFYDVGDYPEALRRALEHAGYDELRAEQARRRATGDHVHMGIGLSTYVEITAGGPSSEFGSVELLPDGRIKVTSGATPFGQGHDTVWAMIVADRTGVAMDRVEVIHGDTDLVPAGGLTVGSRSVQLAGAAVADASHKLIEAARHEVAELLEAAADDVVLDQESGQFHVAGAPSLSVDWAALAARSRTPLSGLSDFSAASPTFPFGAHVAVVDVDAVTGKTVLRRHVAVDDAGKVLNPMLADGQVHGGLAQGIAQALLEAIRYDDDGNPVTTNFADYPVISAAELPMFELVHMETPTFVNELGAKGFGESGTIGAIPAVQNAVVDALSHLGVRHLDTPITPERVWRALGGGSTG